jgi:hypothetical protein
MKKALLKEKDLNYAPSVSSSSSLRNHPAGFGTVNRSIPVAGLHRASPSATLDKK